jgi:hypothetical protein
MILYIYLSYLLSKVNFLRTNLSCLIIYLSTNILLNIFEYLSITYRYLQNKLLHFYKYFKYYSHEKSIR